LALYSLESFVVRLVELFGAFGKPLQRRINFILGILVEKRIYMEMGKKKPGAFIS
jgi:hypothetical protein